jgi:U11/U12 small nuclear ribonucleoprotein SNRNP20
MGRRYHCEYCNKSFIDTPAARRRHLEGANHQRLRKLHYESFQAQDMTLNMFEQQNRPVCRRFQETGFCPYGTRCRYVHLPHLQPVAIEKPPRLEEWLAKRAQMRTEQESNEHQRNDKGTTTMNFHGIHLPPGLPPVHLLPPSVLPPLAGRDDNLPVVLWG